MRILRLVLVSLVTSLLVVSFARADVPLAIAKPTLDTSIERGLHWFVAQEFKRRDVTAFSHWLADMLEKSNPNAAAVLRDKGHAIYLTKEDDYLLRKLIGGKKDFPMDMPMLTRYQPFLLSRLSSGELGMSAGGTEDFLGLALYASDPRLKPMFGPIYDALFDSKLNRYGATHQLLGLIFVRNEHAFPEKRVEAAIKRVSAGIEAELPPQFASGTFTDLIAESLAILSMAGEQDRIKPEWITFLIDHQQPDGRWKQAATESNVNTQIDMDQHATMLALYALIKRQNLSHRK